MSSARRNRGPLTWSRLDNAAKIFPPTVRGADTRVFRLSCELTEMVEPQLLERALADTLERFPHMQMVLGGGCSGTICSSPTGRRRWVRSMRPPALRCTAAAAPPSMR